MNACRAGWNAYYLNASPLLGLGVGAGSSSGKWDAYNLYEERLLRYTLFDALYQNNLFWERMYDGRPLLRETLHKTFGIPKNTRGVFNPVHRLAEFHAVHIVGGTLDPKAGDDTETKSAVPIETENEALRPAIAKLWRDSRWAIHKDNWGRQGALLGDVFLKVIDDPARGRVRLKSLHPGHVKWTQVDHDGTGEIAGYILEEYRHNPLIAAKNLNPTIDPRTLQMPVRFNEECFRDGDKIVFRTYMNGGLYDWTPGPDGLPIGTRAGAMPEWEVPYGFVPLVHTQHLNIGLPFGVAEPHAMLAKLFEGEGLSSAIVDQCHKLLHSPWAALGAKAATPAPKVEGERDELPILFFSGTGADKVSLQAMVAEMPIDAIGAHFDKILTELERDYPELRYYLANELGDASGKAIRIARQAAEGKVQARRTGYDESLVHAQRIALAIGGIRGYEGYKGLGSDDPFADARLDHAIGHRPVFAPDPLDDIEELQAFWTAVGAAVTAGMPLATVLRREGWPEEDIKALQADKQAESDAAMKAMQQKQKLALADVPASGEAA